MGRAYSDDLRCRILQAYARGGVSLRALAERYEVSFEYVRKIRKQQLRSGQMKRIPQSRYGVRRRVDEHLARRIREQIERQPDLTLVQLQDWVRRQERVSLSRSLTWLTLKRLGLGLKKSRSTPKSVTPPKIADDEKSFWKESARRPRKS
jgi:transposase